MECTVQASQLNSVRFNSLGWMDDLILMIINGPFLRNCRLLYRSFSPSKKIRVERRLRLILVFFFFDSLTSTFEFSCEVRPVFYFIFLNYQRRVHLAIFVPSVLYLPSVILCEFMKSTLNLKNEKSTV